MTGETGTEERSQLIKDWREKKIDIVIATSAFGLGVDQQDVRSVIHLCIPETIDRFYQEVGRGGRDGKASISLTLYTKDDYIIAESLNKTSSITLERGMQRWETMFNAKSPLERGSYLVPLDRPPSMSDQDIDMNSEENLKWNRLTLTLMSQGGLIDLEWSQPPQREDFFEDAAYHKAYKIYQNSRLVRIKHPFHLKQETWTDYVEPIRQHRQQRNTDNLDLMKESLLEHPRRCLSEIFSQAYTIPAKGIQVSSACGGCPWCRQQKRASFAQIMPYPRPIWRNCFFSLGEDLKRVLKGANLLLIFYNTFKPDQLEHLLTWFISQGVNNLISPVPLNLTFSPEAIVFTYTQYQPIKLYAVPTLIYCPPSFDLPSNYLNSSNIPKIILLSNKTVDPSRTDRLLIDIFNGRSLSLEVFNQEINFMSVLKQSLATPSRFRGIYRYLLHTKGQKENKDLLGFLLSPTELVKDKNKTSERPMFEASLREAIKCGLLVEQDNNITINPNLPEIARNLQTGDLELPNTLADLFFASNNEDEDDFGLVCAWCLSQDVYDPPNTWEKAELIIPQQQVDIKLGIKLTSNTLYGQMDDWMEYLGLLWGHCDGKKRVIVPDPTLYLKRNLQYLFNQRGEKLPLREYISLLAKKCPLFETGHFRETIEKIIGLRQLNYLSTSTAFALFRLQDEGYIKLIRESDADLMILPKAKGKVDDQSRISHIIWN